MQNPELLRNIWLELTRHRLIITPIIMTVIFYLSYKMGGSISAQAYAFYLFIFFGFIWGTRVAADAICDEINNRTWDWQRTSQLSPLQMSIGKLFGSTCFAWYASAIALSAFIGFSIRSAHPHLWSEVYVLVLGAIFTHTLAILLSLESIKGRTPTKIKSFKYFILALIIGGGLVTSRAYLAASVAPNETIQWFHYQFSRYNYTMVSFTLYCCWAAIALYRGMRLELQHKCIPWVFTAFVVYCMIETAGIVQSTKFSDTQIDSVISLFSQFPLMAAFGVAVFFTYISIFADNISILNYQKLTAAFIHKGLVKGLEIFPRWPITFIFVFALSCWLSTGKEISVNAINRDIAFSPIIFGFSIFFLVVRDILIVHYFRFAPSQKRATATIFFYLLTLYILVPWLLWVLGLHSLAACFRPGFGEYGSYAIVGPLVQSILISFMVLNRWQANTKRI